MTKRLSSVALVLILGGSILAYGACRQQEGKSCQTTTDCKKGLVCCFDGTNASSTLGVCTAGTSCTPIADAAAPDSAVSEDAAVSEDSAVSEDAAVTPDASVTLDASP